MRREQIPLYIGRANRFVERVWSDWIFRDSVPLTGHYHHSGEPLPFDRRHEGIKHPVVEGALWGHAWDSAWFEVEAVIPPEWKGSPVRARLLLDGEFCVFSDTGCPVAGLTSLSVFDPTYVKTDYPITDCCAGGERVALCFEAAANGLFGISRHAERVEGPTRHGWFDAKINRIVLCRIDPQAEAFARDAEIAQNLIQCLPDHAPRRLQLLDALNRAAAMFGDDPERFPAMRQLLGDVLFRPACASDLVAIGVGHAHIDTGWLWPVRESIRKCARTFSSQVALIEKYPGYIFGASQPQHYQFVKEHYPELYAKIGKLVQAGRWELQGGMWVEADCNLISGESMVRQFLHGKNFFRDEFGVDVKTCWIPDVFGYSAAMPQIMKGCGVDYFLTQKISWSQFNEFPHNTFHWRGIDDTEVLTHFPPENNYNAPVLPSILRAAQERFKENHVLPEFMSLFGVGDGGGGPSEMHLERAMRLRDVEGCPPLRFGTAHDFFTRLAERKAPLPTWTGELYLELHRGTLTTQARTKRNNRLLENRLRDTEYLAASATASTYPRAELDALWKKLLINQFHDIIPGSSIRKVYEVTEREHAQALAACDRLIDAAAGTLYTKQADALVLANTLSQTYDRPVELPASWAGHAVTGAAGRELPVQHDAAGSVALVPLAPQEITTLRKGRPCAGAASGSAPLVLENARIRYTFATDGTLTSAWDKEEARECLAPGERGNVLTLYNDRPLNYDAWDVDIFYEEEALETARATGIIRLGDGPVRQGLRINWTVGADSTLTQDIVLAEGSKRLEFRTTADWHETHRMLRVAFPVDIRATEASFDIQYGFVRRPTHRNTAWDMARFEVVAHTYADLSDSERGVALLNDCKYGHRILDNVLDLNLLRSPTAPDPDADMGAHTFTYALLPHAGTLAEGDVMREGAMLNRTPLLLDGRTSDGAPYPFRWESAGVTLEALKRAEKDDAPVIRLVERLGHAGTGTMHLPDGMALEETNLMEWERGPAQAADKGRITLSFKPFEIRTFRVVTG